MIVRQQLQLKDLSLGEIDAKYELIHGHKTEIELFKDSFYRPEYLIEDDFIKFDGKKFFIVGQKGTGKTAILRHLRIKADELPNYSTTFVLLKSDFSEDDKSQFTAAARVTAVELDEPKTSIDDYEYVWRWYIYRLLVDYNQKASIFEDNENWKCFVKLVSAPKYRNEPSFFKKLIPKVKKGNIEIAFNAKFVSTKLGLDLNWENPVVNFNSLVRAADDIFAELLSSGKGVIIFFDELEIALTNTKQFSRDANLIRDLAVTVSTFNILCMQKHIKVKCIAALRSEIVRAIDSTGKEINKILESFGLLLNWHQYGGDILDHPLLKIIEKRLQAAEKGKGLSPSSNVWSKYFDELINRESIKEYILHQTWYRPRDIIRMLRLIRDRFPNDVKFTHIAFNSIRKDYSNACWSELIEEIRAHYTVEELKGIKTMLTGIKMPFTYNSIELYSKQKAEMYDEVNRLLERKKMARILEDLYTIGFIGNTGQRNVRYSFRGDDNISLDSPFMVHRALWQCLSLTHFYSL